MLYKGASNECEPNEYQCENKKCVLKTWRCDGDDDCGDGTDEQNCQETDPSNPCRFSTLVVLFSIVPEIKEILSNKKVLNKNKIVEI